MLKKLMTSLPSNRDFGLTVGFVLAVILLFLWIKYEYLSITLSTLSLSLLVLGAFNSYILLPFNFVWFSLGVLLGKVISPIFISFFYFIIFTPYSVVGRLFSSDLKSIRKRANPDEKTYWSQPSKTNNFENQF